MSEAVRELVLRDQRTPSDRRQLVVRLLASGALQIDGCDLGDGVEQALGAGIREYEWLLEVRQEDVPVVRAALGGAADANVLDVIRDRCSSRPELLESTIRALPIQPTFWSRMGD